MYSKLQAELVVKADDDQYADLYEVAAFYRNHKLTGGHTDWEADTHSIELDLIFVLHVFSPVWKPRAERWKVGSEGRSQ